LLIEENDGDSTFLIKKADRGVPNQRKYLLDAKWWRRWCDFTGLQSNN
jgi:hypothetical protein